jgi:DNA-binding XRE family transcriptional regulator
MITKEKFKEIREQMNSTQDDFGNQLGLSRNMIGMIERGEKPITYSTETKIKLLLLEKDNSVVNGRVIKAPEGKIKRRIKSRVSNKIPVHDVDFEAGKGIEFYDDIRNSEPEYYMDVPDFAGCTAFRSYGISMNKLIDSGAILFATPEEDWREYIEYGQIYGIICHNKRRFLKFVRKSAKPNHFLLISNNPDFDPFDLPISKIKSVWLIHGWLNKRT